MFKNILKMVENETNFKIKTLRSNNSSHITSKQFLDFGEEHGIQRKLSVARTPKQNRVVERKIEM